MTRDVDLSNLNKLFGLLLGLLLLTFAVCVHAEPTLKEVYQAANAGQLQQAETMMQRVLQAHPDSAKAHFVQAELLTRAGKLAEAREALAKAEGLEPGLPFAKPQAVSALKTRLGQADQGSSFLTSDMFWLGMAVLVLIVAAFFMMRKTPAPGMVGSQGAMPRGMEGNRGNTGGYPSAGYGAPQQTGGMGSGILGGLATGAAVGAGIVAGEALMHNIMGDREKGGSALPEAHAAPLDEGLTEADYDMGGDDFGIMDSGSWDDNAVGGDDWT